MNIVKITENKCETCRRILDALPQWFGIEEAKEDYIRDAEGLPMFGCVAETGVVGFLKRLARDDFATYFRHTCWGIAEVGGLR